MRASQIEVLAALGDPTRWQLLQRLSTGRASASGLAKVMPVTRAGIAKHLGILERASLIRRVPAGREVRYEVRPERLREVAQWMSEAEAAWAARLQRLQDLARRT
jgi:DNA-binding transcriptional ArsR family regulator